MRFKTFLVGFAVLTISVAAMSCSDSESEEPSTPVAATDPLSFTVGVTEIGIIGPLRAIVGVDGIPTGPDMVNHAFYTFTRPIDNVRIQLVREGHTVFDQAFPVAPPSDELRLPLSSDVAPTLLAGLEPGLYQRRITASAEDGETLELMSDSVWLFRSDGSPEARARELLNEELGSPPRAPFLIAYEAVDWNDASLGCPEPDVMYAQVITPGFRLGFDHEGTRYQVHTNLDASNAVLCEE